MKIFNLNHLKSVLFLTAFVSLSFYSKSATLTATSSTNLCQSHPFVTLVVNPANALNYTWYFYDVYGNLNQLPSPSTNSFDAFYSGNYFCQVTDANGTFNTNSIMVSQAWNGQYLWQNQSPATACGVNNLAVNTNGIYFSSFQWTLNGQIIPGATTPNYSATVGGHYNCWVGNSCGADTNTYGLYIPYVASVIPSMVTISSTVGNNACVLTPFTLSVPSYTGATYKWYYLLSNGSSSLLNSSSNTISLPGYNSPVTYRYLCNISNACATRNSIVDTINFVSTPSVAISSPSLNFCFGDSLKLTATTPTSGLNYQWSNNGVAINNAISSSYFATVSGSYTVSVTNGASCNASSAAINVTRRSKPSSSITTTSSTTICADDSVQLIANTGTGLTYQWQKYYTNINGAVGLSYYAKSSANYRLLVTNQYGCTKQSSAIAVTVNPKPTATITAAGATTFCNGGSVILNANIGTGLIYNWKKNGVNLSGGSTSQYLATLAGLYRCVITNSFGCSRWSNAITVNVPCREEDVELNKNQFELYPNPSTDYFYINLKGEWGSDKSLRITDMAGRDILFNINSFNSKEKIFHQLNPGLYVVTISDGLHFSHQSLLVR